MLIDVLFDVLIEMMTDVLIYAFIDVWIDAKTTLLLEWTCLGNHTLSFAQWCIDVLIDVLIDV
jgi:hypothetical protein